MNMSKSIHLQDFPIMKDFVADNELVNKMDKIRAICSCALFIRDKNNLRVRLPLNSITIIGNNISEIKEFSDIIADEINVKNVNYINNINEYGEKKLVLNFQKIGSKVGTKMPLVIKASKTGNWKINNNKLEIEEFVFENDEFLLKLEPKDKDTFAIENYDILIKLDLQITKELEYEGMARDLVRIIQQLRKDSKLDISDKICISIKTGYEFLKKSIDIHKEYIKKQTLAIELNIINEDSNSDFSFCEEIDQNPVIIGFSVTK